MWAWCSKAESVYIRTLLENNRRYSPMSWTISLLESTGITCSATLTNTGWAVHLNLISHQGWSQFVSAAMGNAGRKSSSNLWTSRKKNGTLLSSYRYVPPTMEDWRLQKGDLLEVIGETELWFYVRKLSLRSSKSRHHREKKGYIPAEFVKRVTPLEAQP